jgi:predicted phage terminase large subunit-like protein
MQFWYMVSRNRSMCGVRPYIRATCNPDADSWVAELIGWWIDQDTGLPIPERSGALRWFVRVGEDLKWADHPQELACYTMLNDAGEQVPIPPKSLTFIPAKLTDNKALMAADPGYMASLLALPLVERERLLGGNWKIRPAAGLYFQRAWCRVVDAVPAGTIWGRGYDLAATIPSADNPDPDFLASVRIGRMPDGRYIVSDCRTIRTTPAGMERFILNTASEDGNDVEISLPQDPGQAGKVQVTALVKMLGGYTVRYSTETGSKETRFGPFSAQAEAGNVDVLRGTWNDGWFTALEGFPIAKHDDEADATSRAFEIVAINQRSGWFL